MSPREPVDASALIAMYARMGATYEMVLRCEECEAEQPCPREQVEAYARVGWPKHCDKAMSLFVA